MANETMGQRIARLRRDRGLSLSGLAYKAGVSESTVRGIESGVTASPKFETGILFAEALGVTPRYLAFGDAERNEPT